ncbi:MAG: DUF881 domain-containing protein [Nocardioides sp.]
MNERPAPERPRDAGRPGDTGARLFRHGVSSRLLIAALMVGLGFAAATQFRSQQSGSGYVSYRQQDLIDLNEGLIASRSRAESELARLEAQATALHRQVLQRDAAAAEARTRASVLTVPSTTAPVSGEGVRVRIEDPAHHLSSAAFLDTIEELRAGGATAIEINDSVRVGTRSWVDADASGSIVVDGHALSAPYTLEVTGAPDTLAGALTFAQGPVAAVTDAGGTLTFERERHLTIDSVVTLAPLRLAKAVP